MTDTTQAAPTITNESTILKLVPLFEQVGSLMEDVKVIVKEAKEAGLDAPALQKIAKARADQKLADLADKTQSLLDLIDSLT